MNETFLDREALAPFARLFTTLQQTHPLVDCITNIVTVNDVANGLLAIDARPVMASAPDEISDFVRHTDALLLNLGATASEQREAMLVGAMTANLFDKPIIVDPVGVGASPLRHQFLNSLLKKCSITAIRGNISEIKAIAGLTTEAAGVDAALSDLGDPAAFQSAVELAQLLAKVHHTVIAISGPRDIISDGTLTYVVHGGNESMTRVTGSGCTLTGLVAAFLAVDQSNPALATACAIALMCRAGDIALEKVGAHATASFRIAMFDALSALTAEDCLSHFHIQQL